MWEPQESIRSPYIALPANGAYLQHATRPKQPRAAEVHSSASSSGPQMQPTGLELACCETLGNATNKPDTL